MTARPRLLVAGLVLGVLVRLAALPLPGTGDLDVFKVWSISASQDLTGVYGVGGSPPERRLLQWRDYAFTVDYPPLALAELGVVGRIYRWWRPNVDDGWRLNAAAKLPGLLAETIFVIVILTWGRRLFGADTAAWMALAFWLNPAILLDGSVLGYLDAQMGVAAALALVAACTGLPFVAGALAAAAVLTKAQAVFVLPVIGAALIGTPIRNAATRLAKAASGGALVSAVVLVPFVVRGAWSNLVQAVGRLATHDMLSANAANIWWIFTWVLRVRDVWDEWGWRRSLTQELRILAITRATALGYPNARVVGLVLVGVAVAWAAWQALERNTPGEAAALAGWSAYAYSMLAAQVHENHLYLAVPLLAIAAGIDRRYRPTFLAVSIVCALNLLVFYGLGRDMPTMIDRGWTWIDASVVLAAVNVGVFVWTTWRIGRWSRSS